jgi:hypothetical protein
MSDRVVSKSLALRNLIILILLWSIFFFNFFVAAHDLRERIVFAGMLVGFSPFIFLAVRQWRTGTYPPARYFARVTVIIVTGAAVALGAFLSRPQTIRAILDWYLRLHGFLGPYFPITVTAVLGSLGYLLFWFKMTSLAYYSRLEIAFGLACCYAAIEKSKGTLNMPDATTIGAAIYVVVRGLDNHRKARDEATAGAV